MNQEDLVGTFRLVTWRRQDQSEPFGRHPEGVLHYCPNGRMSVTFLKQDRTKLGMSSAQMAEARRVLDQPWRLPAQVRTVVAMARFAKAALGFMAYAGTFSVTGDAVSHHVDLALVPDDIGTEVVRIAALNGSMLTLTTPAGDILTWERLTERPQSVP
jgi:hypothetical protein